MANAQPPTPAPTFNVLILTGQFSVVRGGLRFGANTDTDTQSPKPGEIGHVGIDLFSRFSLVCVEPSAASARSARLFTAMQNILGVRIEKVLTDNGSDFAKDFHRVVTANDSTHWHTHTILFFGETANECTLRTV